VVDVVYVMPGQGLVTEGMVLPLLNDSRYGRYAADLSEMADDHARDFGLDEPMRTIWQRSSTDELKDSRLTHLSMFVGCNAVQSSLEEVAGEAGITLNVKAIAPLSLGRYLGLVPSESALMVVGERGMELRGRTGREDYGWPQSLRIMYPDLHPENPVFDPDHSGYNMYMIAGINPEYLSVIQNLTGIRLSNINARDKEGKLTVNISGPERMVAASAADFATRLGANVRALNLPPFHNYDCMAGFELIYGGLIRAHAQMHDLELKAPIINDMTGGLITTTEQFVEEAGAHGRNTNRFYLVAMKVERMAGQGVIPVVVGANEFSAKAMRALLLPESKQRAVLLTDKPESIDSAVEALKKAAA